ncbi:trehalose transporter 1-like protein isoform X2 [Leptinotarsa decemlineata]|uniref:trehalose transporter 1-like protein isoform X2 n=1 Tax=Leptinotarsa decemlineata TaxID=7539 RepID=UPI003D309607
MRVNIMRTFGDYRLEADLKNAGKSWPQVLAILIACLSCVSNGMLMSWPSPYTPKIIKDENYDIDEGEVLPFTILPPVAMMITCLVASTLSDTIGRKKTLFIVYIPQILAWALPAISTNLYLIYAARILEGVGDGIIFTALPMYIGEVASPTVRGTWGNSLTILYYVGEFAITIIGSYLSVKISSLIGVILSTSLSTTYFILPESPYYLLMKDDTVNARRSLKTLTRKSDVEEDLLQLKADVDRQMSERGTWTSLFVIPTNRKALIAAIFMRFSQNMSGIVVALTCTQTIFEESGSDISPEISSICFIGFWLLLNTLASLFNDKLGRRKSYIGSLIPSGIILIALSVYFYMEQEISMKMNSGWIPITGMLLYVLFNSYGVCIVPTLMMGELFSTSIKAKAMTLLVVVFGISILFSTVLFQVLSIKFGLYAPFLLFGVSNLVSSILSFYLVPETKGKTLEQIQQYMNEW